MSKPSHCANVVTAALFLSAPGVWGQEVRASVGGGQTVPVGSPGTRVMAVERASVLNTSYAVVRSRDPGLPSRCAFPVERVAAWGLLDGRWTEMASEVIDRCPNRVGATLPRAVHARVVQWQPRSTVGAELHVRVIDTQLPITAAPLVRFRRQGDRFVGHGAVYPLAASLGSPNRATLANLAVTVDGDLREWQGQAPWFEGHSSQGAAASVWLSAQGTRLQFAARMTRTGQGSPSLRLHLAEQGTSTAVLLGDRDNTGRVLDLRCGSTAYAEASFRCREEGGVVVMEGETDLGTMLWRDATVRSVSALARVSWGEHSTTSSDPAQRLQVFALPASFDLLEGASESVMAQCARGFRGRVSATSAVGGVEGMVTCGTTCRGGICEHTLGTTGASSRLSLNSDRSCLTLSGSGGDSSETCHGGTARLVGSVPARGFDLVVAIERTQPSGERHGELWSLVTTLARWQRIWVGPTQRTSEVATTLRLEGEHPRLCHAESCEVVDGITLVPADRGAVTTGVARLLQNVGLVARRED